MSREQWLDGALRYLRRGGGELRIDRLTRALGVTKGSFYHHFTNRAEFIDAILEHWDKTYNLSVAAELERAGDDPREKLRMLLRTIYENGLADYDLPVRAWALDNARVRRFLRRTDQWRMDVVRQQMEALGYIKEELELRTRLFVTFASLEVTLYNPLPRTQLLREIDARLEMLIGQ